jgi:hypothetical protein
LLCKTRSWSTRFWRMSAREWGSAFAVRQVCFWSKMPSDSRVWQKTLNLGCSFFCFELNWNSESF